MERRNCINYWRMTFNTVADEICPLEVIMQLSCSPRCVVCIWMSCRRSCNVQCIRVDKWRNGRSELLAVAYLASLAFLRWHNSLQLAPLLFSPSFNSAKTSLSMKSAMCFLLRVSLFVPSIWFQATFKSQQKIDEFDQFN